MRPAIRPVVGRQPPRRGVGLRIDDPDIGIDGAVRISVVVADVGDARAVRRPYSICLVELRVGGQLIELVRCHVPQIKLGVLVVLEIALDVFLEVVAVDDDRFRLLLLLVGVFRLVFVLVLIGLDSQQQRLRIRRPRIGREVALHIGELMGFAAAPIEHPYLLPFAWPGRPAVNER